MFREIVSNSDDVSELFRLSKLLRQRGRDGLPAALRCLDHGVVRITDSRLRAADLSQLAEALHHFSTYTNMLRRFAFTPDLCNDKAIRDLFAIQGGTSEDLLIVPKDTFLYRRCARVTAHSRTHSGDQELSVLRGELNRQLGLALRERLLERVRGLDLLSRNLSAFQVCLQFSASGFCRRIRCPQAHVAVTDSSEELYNLRIRIILQMVLINDSVFASEGRLQWEERRT